AEENNMNDNTTLDPNKFSRKPIPSAAKMQEHGFNSFPAEDAHDNTELDVRKISQALQELSNGQIDSTNATKYAEMIAARTKRTKYSDHPAVRRVGSEWFTGK